MNGSATLKNSRHEAYARVVSEGKLKPTQAFRKVMGKKTPGERVTAHRWLTNANIAARIAHIQAKALQKTGFSLDSLLNFATGLVELTPEQFKTVEAGRFCQMEETVTDGKKTTKRTLMSKMDALKLLAHVCGYTRPEVADTAKEIGQGGGLHITVNLPDFMRTPRELPPRNLIELLPAPAKKAKAKSA